MGMPSQLQATSWLRVESDGTFYGELPVVGVLLAAFDSKLEEKKPTSSQEMSLRGKPDFIIHLAPLEMQPGTQADQSAVANPANAAR